MHAFSNQVKLGILIPLVKEKATDFAKVKQRQQTSTPLNDVPYPQKPVDFSPSK